MSATALSAATTVAIDLPVRMIPGPGGLDSPAVTGDIPRYRWFAWIDVDADRHARRPSGLAALAWALGHPVAQRWPAWWLTPTGNEWLVHLAQVAVVVDGGHMLLAACGRSAPWIGSSDNVVGRVDADVSDVVPLCPGCQERAGD